MKKRFVKLIALLLVLAMTPVASLPFAVISSAWKKCPVDEIDLSTDLVGMMNVKIFQDRPYITNVNTVEEGQVLSGITLPCYKFAKEGTAIDKTWPAQVGDGPYTEDQLESYFDASCIEECMDLNKGEVAVYMLFDFGDPDSTKVKKNMAELGIKDIDEYYALMVGKTKIQIAAYAGGGTAHETAITAYYRYCEDWREYATNHNSTQVPRQDLLDLGIAAPNENRYFFETKESQKMINGGNAFPGTLDPSVAEYIDTKESYAQPVWEDENEEASWNIINPVPTCNIYSRWMNSFSADTDYQTYKDIKDRVVAEKYGENYTDGQWYGATGDTTIYGDGLNIDDIIVPKNWEWNTIPYQSTKSGTTYTYTSASKSHLGYGEYCPAATESYHNFNVPVNQANNDAPSRFMTVMVRETGTMCGLDGNGHWHSVKVTGVPTTSIKKFAPELIDDDVVIDYGMSVDMNLDNNDFVWAEDPSDANSLPAIKKVELSADGENFSAGPVEGKFGTLELTHFEKTWNPDACTVKYTPKIFVDTPDIFYYKVYPDDVINSDNFNYKPLVGKISVVPASVMYYEDSFSATDNGESNNFGKSLNFSGNWTYVDNDGSEIIGKPVDGKQSNENINYGYDIYYDENLGYSDGSAHKASKSDTLTFTFKGTGCDVIMRTDANDGTIQYSVTKNAINADGTKAEETVEVVAKKTVGCRHNNDKTLYQLPVLSLQYDEYAYYTITIKSAVTKNVYIDGIRVYNPLGFYGSNGSDNAAMKTYYTASEKEIIFKPVYDGIYDTTVNDGNATISFAGIVNNWNEWHGDFKDLEQSAYSDFETYCTIGPNNEVYLSPNQALVFTVVNANKLNTNFEVEAKAVNDPTAMEISTYGAGDKAAQKTALNTNTAMYYRYEIPQSDSGAPTKIVITNSGTGILSISNFKYTAVLGTAGAVNYKFFDEDDGPVAGVSVMIMDRYGNKVLDTASDKSGVVSLNDIPEGTYYSYFTVPEGMSRIPTRTFEVSKYNIGDSETFRIFPRVLNIGSNPEYVFSPYVTAVSKGAVISNYRPKTVPGSYKITYTFDSNNKFADGKTYLNGTVTLTVHEDGSVDYYIPSVGSDKGSVSGVSGKSDGVVKFADGDMTINYLKIVGEIMTAKGWVDKNKGFQVTDMSNALPEGTTIEIQAFEKDNLEGEYGDVAVLTFGEDPVYVSPEHGTVTYSFKDEQGNPVEGVVVKMGNLEFVSDENGIATTTNAYIIKNTASFRTPRGYGAPVKDTFTLTMDERTYYKEFILNDIDLTIGAHPSVNYKTSASYNSNTKKVTMNYFRTPSPAGSYQIDYPVDYSINKDSYMTGTISVIINTDGSASYIFNGSGKNNKNNLITSGELSSNDFSFSESQIEINYYNVIYKMCGSPTDNNQFKFKDAISTIFANGKPIDITAYSMSSASGTYGNTETVILGASSELSPYIETSLEYTFVDSNNNPVAGVKVTVDGKEFTSNANGVVKTKVLALDKNYTAAFDPGEKYFEVADDSFSLSLNNRSHSKTITVYENKIIPVTYTFVDNSGNKVSGVDVTIGTTTVTSDENGTAGFNEFRAGSYSATFSIPEKYKAVSGEEFTLERGANSYQKTITLYEIKPIPVKFTLKDDLGAPVVGAVVAINNETVTTDSNGVAEFTDLMEGSYTAVFVVSDDYKAVAADSFSLTLEGGDYEKDITVNRYVAEPVTYTFKDQSGNPVAGVEVTIDNITVTSDANGVASFDEIEVGQKTVTFTAPAHYQMAASANITVTENGTNSFEQTANAIDYTIGSYPELQYEPYANTSTTTVTFNDFRTFSDAESYKITFSGIDYSVTTGNGPQKTTTTIKGNLTVTVNANGSASYSFNGTGTYGKDGKSSVSTSGTLNNGVVSYNSSNKNYISINYYSVFQAMTGNTAYITDISSIMSTNKTFEMTAYELSNASTEGEYGNTASVAIVTSPKIKDDTVGSATYTFKDADNNPVSGVKVTINETTRTSGSNGVVTFANLNAGSYTATFTVPSGFGKVKSDTFAISKSNVDYSKNVTLYAGEDEDYTIGSAPELTMTPSLTVGTSTVTFNNIKTKTEAGSYKITYNFSDWDANDGYHYSYTYLDNKYVSYADGLLVVYVNNDGTARAVYTGDRYGMSLNYGTSLSSKDVMLDRNAIVETETGLVLDYSSILSSVYGQKYTLSFDEFIFDGAGFTVQAFSDENGMGDYGDEKVIRVGEAAQYKSNPSRLTSVKNLALGSGVFIGTPFISIGSSDGNLIISNCTTNDNAGSYVLTYNMNGTANGGGYVSDNSKLVGDLTLIFNSDGTGYYDFIGNAIIDGELVDYSAGTQGEFDFSGSNSRLSADLGGIVNELLGKNVSEDYSSIFPSDSKMYMQAFSEANGQGDSGDVREIAVDSYQSPIQVTITAVVNAIQEAVTRIFGFFRNLFGLN